MDVLDDQQQPLLASWDGEQRHHGFEQSQLRLGGITNRGYRLIAGELWVQLSQFASRRSKRGGETGDVLAIEVVADCLDEREVGKRQLCLAAGTPQHLPAKTPSGPCEQDWMATGFSLNGCSFIRESQSIAFFSTPGIDQLYSGVTNKTPSAARMAAARSSAGPGKPEDS
jgi:hypothetical protein